MKKLVVVLLLVSAFPASAQIESALLSKITFNLTNPGGKSLAMGGAFTAIADDATAAIANPAGLGLLSSVEVGVSGKRSDDVIGLVTARSTAKGSLSTPYPEVRGVNSDISARASGVEFAGVVLPVSRRFVAAVSFAENLRFEGDPGEDGYTYVELRDNRSASDATRRDYLFEYREHGAVSLRNRLLGLSAAFRATDRLRIGAGVTLNRMELDLQGDAGGAHRIVTRTFLTPTLVETLTTTMAIQGLDQSTFGFVVGVHADLVEGGKLTAGAVYRQTGKATGTLQIGGDVRPPLVGQETRPFSARVPRDAAVGLAARPFPGLTVAAEAQWIAYGDFIDRALPIVIYRGLAGPFPGFPVGPLLADLSPPDDVVVPRIGIEYVASTADLLLAFRLGYHREPARGVTANLSAREDGGTAYDVNDPPFSESVRTVYDGGKPDDRFTGGLGATVSRRVSFDLAFDVGRFSQVLSASLFYRF